MRTSTLITVATLLCLPFATGCQNSPASQDMPAEPANPIAGAWELVHVERTTADGETTLTETEAPLQVKVFTDNHFALYHMDEVGAFTGASTGTYRLEGNRFIETHLHNSDARFEDMGGALTIAWEYAIEEGMLIMSGPLSAVDGAGNDVMEAVFGGVTIYEERRPAR